MPRLTDSHQSDGISDYQAGDIARPGAEMGREEVCWADLIPKRASTVVALADGAAGLSEASVVVRHQVTTLRRGRS